MVKITSIEVSCKTEQSSAWKDVSCFTDVTCNPKSTSRCTYDSLTIVLWTFRLSCTFEMQYHRNRINPILKRFIPNDIMLFISRTLEKLHYRLFTIIPAAHSKTLIDHDTVYVFPLIGSNFFNIGNP